MPGALASYDKTSEFITKTGLLTSRPLYPPFPIWPHRFQKYVRSVQSRVRRPNQASGQSPYQSTEFPFVPRKWSFHPHDEAAINRLSRDLKVTPLVAQVLLARGYSTADDAKSFLEPKLSNLHDPALLPGVSEASSRIVDAIRQKRRITIYGDYDVDGVTSTSLLWHCLKLSAAEVDYYIPCRQTEGYGLNEAAVRQLHEEDPDRLLISVDCGIASVKEAALAAELGLELIITDHHTIGPELPDAAVLVHPRLPDTEYPDENGSRGDGRNLVQVYIPISHVYDVIASANGFIARQGHSGQ